MIGANGYNNQIYNFDRQIQEKRSEIAELEKQKIQAQFAQPTILNQTIQAGPQASGIRYAESIDEVKREMIFLDTLFVNRAFTNMWYKKPNGEIKTYLLEEFIPKDEKDIRIESLENEIKKLKEQRENESSKSNNSRASIQTPGTTVGTYENGSAEVIIPTVSNTSIQIVNNSENPVTVPARGASLVVKREG